MSNDIRKMIENIKNYNPSKNNYLSGGEEIRNYNWRDLIINQNDIFRGVEDGDILSSELPMFSENPIVAIEYARTAKGGGKYFQGNNKYNEDSKLQRYSIKNGAKILDTTLDLEGTNILRRILGKKEVTLDEYRWYGGWKVYGYIDNITTEGIERLKNSAYDLIKLTETDRDTGIGIVDGASYVVINKNAITENPLK